jgi:homoserine dehydrogenase
MLALLNRQMKTKPLRIALLGFGTVGGSVTKILCERPELADRLQLTHIFNRSVARKRVAWVPASVTWTDDIDAVFGSKPDVVVEVVGGVDPAGDWVRRALQQGAAVVTANKMLLATQGPELLHLAATHHTQLRFEAAVAGGVPVVQGVREGLAGDRLTRVAGILNGTSNYVLSTMEKGDESMTAVLVEARRLGFAEADPSADIDGDDAAAKIVVLAGMAFQRHLRLADIPKVSIRPISAADFRYASRLGCTIRQIARVEVRGDGFYARVGPTLVRSDSQFGLNVGANNVVTISGLYGGETTFSGAGAGGPATAVAVVSDLVALTRGHQVRGEEWAPATIALAPLRPYYLRFVIRDRPGIVASIAEALARRGINLEAMLQEPGYPKDALPFAITVEACDEAPLRAALRDIGEADFHVEPTLALPMLLRDNLAT